MGDKKLSDVAVGIFGDGCVVGGCDVLLDVVLDVGLNLLESVFVRYGGSLNHKEYETADDKDGKHGPVVRKTNEKRKGRDRSREMGEG